MSPFEIVGPIWTPTAPPSVETFAALTLQPIPLLPAVMLAIATWYLASAIRLWSTGRSWSITRTISFLSGCLLTAYVLGAGIEGYGYEMFSVFMFQQLMLTMAIPALLVSGSPGTLLLRSTPHHGLGRAVFAVAFAGLRSRFGRLILHPAFTIPLFLAMFYGVYFTALADRLLASWAGHVALEAAFLLAGILFTAPLLSRDPLPRRETSAGRLVDMFIEMPLHAFFGVIVMTATAPLLRSFSSPPSSWNLDVLADQGVAGGLAWSFGELPSLIIIMVLMVRWHRDDTRKAAAADRQADRDGDAELTEYNAYLDRIRSGRPSTAPGTRTTP